MKVIAQDTPPAEPQRNAAPLPYFAVVSTFIRGEIIQSRGKVVFGEEGRTRWQNFLNREPPKNVEPTFFGDPVGLWEGDTRAMDTVGPNG